MIAETEQFIEKARVSIEQNNELYIVNSGSFFSPQIPREYMTWLAEKIKNNKWALKVDSRADSKFRRYSGEIGLLVDASRTFTVAMGLEVADDEVLARLDKRCNLEQYVSAAKTLREMGAGTKSYILLGPPALYPEGHAQEPYRESIDHALKMGFKTAKFAVEDMGSSVLGLSPFFPYKELRLTEDWWPVSTTEAAETANQLRQVYSDVKVDFTNRQIHLWWGNFFKRKGLPKPINHNDPESITLARENVALICESVIGRRGRISKVKKR